MFHSYAIKKKVKITHGRNNQIWNNKKKQLLFVCIIIRDNIGFGKFF